MIDKELERKIKRVKEFMELWVKFHDMYKSSINRDTITPEEEKNFLETKSIIARKYQALKNLLGSGATYEDRTFDVVLHVLSLKGVSVISDLSRTKIESDWHNSYIQLNKILGDLEGEQDNLRKVSRAGLALDRIKRHPLTNLTLALIIIFAAYFIVAFIQKSYRAETKMAPEGKIEFKEAR